MEYSQKVNPCALCGYFSALCERMIDRPRSGAAAAVDR